MAAGGLYERVITCKRVDLIIVAYSANTITRRCTERQSSCGGGVREFALVLYTAAAHRGISSVLFTFSIGE